MYWNCQRWIIEVFRSLKFIQEICEVWFHLGDRMTGSDMLNDNYEENIIVFFILVDVFAGLHNSSFSEILGILIITLKI